MTSYHICILNIYDVIPWKELETQRTFRESSSWETNISYEVQKHHYHIRSVQNRVLFIEDDV